MRNFSHKKPKPAQKRPVRSKANINKPSQDKTEHFKNEMPALKPVKNGALLIYGHHSVEAALQNPARKCFRLWLTAQNKEKYQNLAQNQSLSPKITNADEIEQYVGPNAVHQGILLECAPLPQRNLDMLTGQRPILVLDQVTDPHNVGAILRSASVFGAEALIMTARNSPPLSGIVAKTASGGLEHVPVILVNNLVRSLEKLNSKGIWRIGLDGDADDSLENQSFTEKVALILGAEGKGLRRLTRENCDLLCALTASGPLKSLNVSNAAAVGLHCLQLARSSRLSN